MLHEEKVKNEPKKILKPKTRRLEGMEAQKKFRLKLKNDTLKKETSTMRFVVTLEEKSTNFRIRTWTNKKRIVKNSRKTRRMTCGREKKQRELQLLNLKRACFKILKEYGKRRCEEQGKKRKENYKVTKEPSRKM